MNWTAQTRLRIRATELLTCQRSTDVWAAFWARYTPLLEAILAPELPLAIPNALTYGSYNIRSDTFADWSRAGREWFQSRPPVSLGWSDSTRPSVLLLAGSSCQCCLTLFSASSASKQHWLTRHMFNELDLLQILFIWSKIWGFQGCEYEECRILGCCSVWFNINRRFGGTFRLRLQGRRYNASDEKC
jgi:hypothetical protein